MFKEQSKRAFDYPENWFQKGPRRPNSPEGLSTTLKVGHGGSWRPKVDGEAQSGPEKQLATEYAQTVVYDIGTR